MYLETGLFTADRKAQVVLTVNEDQLRRVTDELSDCRSVSLPEETVAHIQLLDEYESATIEGAVTTISKVRAGLRTKSEIMVRQSLAGLQCLLCNALSEDTLISAWRTIVTNCCENVSAGIDGYRTGMVYVGNAYRIIHVPPTPNHVPPMVRAMLSYRAESDIITAIVYGFYLIYVHPFADGNGRLSRALMQKFIGTPALPLSKAINATRSSYYVSIRDSEFIQGDKMDITPFAEYILMTLLQACRMYKLLVEPLSEQQSTLLQKVDLKGKGYVSYNKAEKILGVDLETAVTVINSLVDKGYLEFDESAGAFKVIRR